MAEQLKNELSFSNLAPGASIVLPHSLQTSLGTLLEPDIVFVPVPGLGITADDVNVTVTNNTEDSVSGLLLVEAWHTIERAFGDKANINLPVKPYVVVSESGSSSGACCPVVYRPGDPAGSLGNVFVTWPEVYAALQATAGGGPRELQYDDHFVSPAPIPVGVYDMTNVVHTNVPKKGIVLVEFADGAQFTYDRTQDWAMQFRGYGLGFISNRRGPVAPFVNISILCGGNNVRFYNTDPAALPMFEVGLHLFNLLLFDGAGSRASFGQGSDGSALFNQDMPAPLIDLKGGFVEVVEGGCFTANNTFTDSVGGGAVAFGLFGEMGIFDVSKALSFPALAPGSVFHSFTTHLNRHQVSQQSQADGSTPIAYGPKGTVVPAISPYAMVYNEIALVDTTDAVVTVTAPAATNSWGERFTVKDVGAHADTHAITITPQDGETVEAPTITAGLQAKTWTSDGYGNWWLTAVT